MLTGKQITANLRAGKKNLEAKLAELAQTTGKISTLESQLEAARGEYDRLDSSGRADPAAVRRLRELTDLLDRSERVGNETEATIAKLEADLRATISVSAELYADSVRTRVDRLEKQLGDMLRPFYRDVSRAAYVAQQSDCLTYLRSHLRMELPQADPAALARWVIRRLDFAIQHENELPWGRYKPEPLGTPAQLPQPEEAAAA